MKYYLRMEGVNLHSFVSDTKDLSTVRGGGLLLLDSVKRVEDWVKDNFPAFHLSPISTGASNGLFSFEAETDEQAGKLRMSVSEFLRGHEKLQHATFVVDVQKANSQFRDDREALWARNRWRQWQQPTVVVPEYNADPQVQVCHVDRIRPAISLHAIKGRRVSSAVDVRHSYGRLQKQEFYASEMKRYFDWDFHGTFVNDLEALTHDESRGNLHRKMAVIYLDGNAFGKIQSKHCQTEGSQSDFDILLKEYRANALKSLLEKMDSDDGYKTQDGAFRLETLLWGGDEIIWVVPAWKGWEVLAEFFKISELWHFQNEALKHAAGLVFCHHNAPIHRIVNLCRQSLAESVKEELKAAGENKNYFQYAVLESFDHIGRDLKGFRESLCPHLQAGRELRFSLDGEKMKNIAVGFRLFKEDFPRNKAVRGAHAALKDCKGPGQNTSYQDFVERLAEIISPELTDALAREFSPYFGNPPGLWLHLADLWDYISEETT